MANPALDLRDARILIVDDVPANIAILREALEAEDYRIAVATSGQDALRLALRSAPDLILLDVVMPGMDGYETCRRLKAEEATPQVPVLFLTAHADTEAVVRCFQAGGVDCIAKPFHKEEVLARIRTHLERARLTREVERKNAALEAEVAERARRERRQAALYQVREQVWDMRGADHIERVVKAVGESLREMGVPVVYFGVNVIDPELRASIAPTTMDRQGEWLEDLESEREAHGRTILGFWERGEVAYRRDLHTHDPLNERQRIMHARSVVDVPFSHGTLAVSSPEPNAFSDDDIAVLQEMADVLSEGFRRRDDLQALQDRNEALEAEVAERARRERRQAARYRVREQVWKMQNAGDIERVMDAVRAGLVELGAPFAFFGVNIVDREESAGVAVRTIGPRGDSAPPPDTEAAAYGKALIRRFLREGRTLYRRDLHADDPFGERATLPGLRAVIDVPFSHGTVAMSSFLPDAFTAEDVAALEELANVLSEGFRRMDDLRQLEQRHAELEQEVEERKEAERQMRGAKEEAERANRAKSVFLANMSHEIRTPMNAILGYAQILSGQAGLDERQRRAVETIAASGQHLMGLINDILDISKIEAGREELKTANFDLGGLVRGLGAMFEVRCGQKGLQWRLELEVGQELPETLVHGDQNKLRQVLINLLGNAVKFTDQGQVALRVEGQGGDRYYFAVSDTGPGIPTDRQQAIFEPFQQESEGAARGGTGLGLAISRRHVELMGGVLGVESQPGAGARFFFSVVLPRGEQEPAADEAAWSRARRLVPGQAVRALVVDDVATNRDILGQILERAGAQVELAASGQEALERARRWRPDIVFMDMRMPGMDGVETRRRLMEEHGAGAMKVVAVTASVFQHQRQGFLEEGFDGFIDKPLRVGQVFECLVQQLGVAFDMAEPETGEARLNARDWEGLVLPAPLAEQLRAALHIHSISALNRNIEALAGLGGPAQQLAAHLRELAGQFDLEGVEAVLATVPVRSSSS